MRKFHLILALLPLILAFQNCSETKTSSVDLDLPYLNSKSRPFHGCDELKSWKESRVALYEEIISNPPKGQIFDQPLAAQADSASAASSAAPVTNIQESGVDEADMVKANDRFLFVARSHSIEVVNRTSLATVQRVVHGLRAGRLYLDGDRLILLAVRTNGFTAQTSLAYYPDQSLVVRIYQVDSNGLLSQQSEREFRGNFVSSRLASGQLILVFRRYGFLRDAPIADGLLGDVPCANVQIPVVNDFNFDFTSIHKIDVRTGEKRSLGMPGLAQEIYMAGDHLYLTGHSYSWFWFDDRVRATSLWQSQIVTKIEASPTSLKYLAAGAVIGNIHNVWSLKEIGDRFFMATTYWDSRSTNRLWTLRQNGTDLQVVGKSEEFGVSETIRSVRFIGDNAHIVTFRQTDPLYTFDIRQDEPRLLSEVKIPGFSAYLHPLSGGRLFGVGYGATNGFVWNGGLQLSLFDIQNPSAVSTLQQIELGGNMSSALAAEDHHAFYSDGNIIGLPVILYAQAGLYAPVSVDFSGALFVTTDNNKIQVPGRVSHNDLAPTGCRSRILDVKRVFKLDNRLLTVSNFGIKASDPANFATIAAKPFDENQKECDVLAYGPYY